MVFITIVFVPLVFVLQSLMNSFIADVIAISIAFCGYFFVLQKRAIAVMCPQCNGYIETNTPWKCGNMECQKTNLKVGDFPVINHCEHCEVEQKAFECPHCRKPIYLGEDKLKTIYATFTKEPGKNKPQRVKIDKISGKVFKQQEEKHDLLHELELTRLKGDLMDAKSKIEPVKPKSKAESLRSNVGRKTELDDEVKRLKAEADKEFAGDEPSRLRRHAEIDAEARELL